MGRPFVNQVRSAAHKFGIVHRDIKPANIMLAQSENGETVKVLDFGIARMVDSDLIGVQTQHGIILGTPAYMSPEQAEGLTGENIDSRSDIYSLGMIVYQMLTGKVAFHGDTWMQTLQKHRYEPLPPSQRRTDLAIPASIERTVLKALSKNREDRQATAAEFAAELTALARQTDTKTLVEVVPDIDYATSSPLKTAIGEQTAQSGCAPGPRDDSFFEE